MENVKPANIELLKRVITDLVENDDTVERVVWSQPDKSDSFTKDTDSLSNITEGDFSPLGFDQFIIFDNDGTTLGRFYFDLYSPKGIIAYSPYAQARFSDIQHLRDAPCVVHEMNKTIGGPEGDKHFLHHRTRGIAEMAESDGDYKAIEAYWCADKDGVVQSAIMEIRHNAKDDTSISCYITVDADTGIRVNGCDGLRGNDKVVLPHTIGDRDDNGIWALECEQELFLLYKPAEKEQAVDDDKECENTKFLRRISKVLSKNASVEWANENIPEGGIRTVAEDGKVVWNFIPDFYYHKSGWDVFTVINDPHRAVKTKETVAPFKFGFDVHNKEHPITWFCASPQFNVPSEFNDVPRLDLALTIPSSILSALQKVENAIGEAGFKEWDTTPCAYPQTPKNNIATAVHTVIRASGRVMGVVTIDTKKGVWLRNDYICVLNKFEAPFRKAIAEINSKFMADDKFDAFLRTDLGYGMFKDVVDVACDDNKPQAEMASILSFLSHYDDRANYAVFDADDGPASDHKAVQIKTLDKQKRKIDGFEDFPFSPSWLTRITVHDFTSVTLGTILFSTNPEIGIGVMGVSFHNDWNPECPDLRDAPRIVTKETYADYAIRNATRAFVTEVEEQHGVAVVTHLSKKPTTRKDRGDVSCVDHVLIEVFEDGEIVSLVTINNRAKFTVSKASRGHAGFHNAMVVPCTQRIEKVYACEELDRLPGVDSDARVNLVRDVVRCLSSVEGVQYLKWINGTENGPVLSVMKKDLQNTLDFIRSEKFSDYGYDMFSCTCGGSELTFATNWSGNLINAWVAPISFLELLPKNNDVRDAITTYPKAQVFTTWHPTVGTASFVTSYFSSLLSQGFSVFAVSGAKKVDNISKNANWYRDEIPGQKFAASLGSPFTFIVRLDSHVMGAIQLTGNGTLSLVNNYWASNKFNIREWVKEANAAILKHGSAPSEVVETKGFTGTEEIPTYANKMVGSIMKLWQDRRYPDKVNHAYETALLIAAVTQGEYGKASSVISGAYKLWTENMHVNRFEVKHPALGDKFPMVKRSMRDSDFSEYSPSVYNFTNNLLSVIALAI